MSATNITSDTSSPVQEETDRPDGVVRGAATKIADLGAKTTRWDVLSIFYQPPPRVYRRAGQSLTGMWDLCFTEELITKLKTFLILLLLEYTPSYHQTPVYKWEKVSNELYPEQNPEQLQLSNFTMNVTLCLLS